MLFSRAGGKSGSVPWALVSAELHFTGAGLNLSETCIQNGEEPK